MSHISRVRNEEIDQGCNRQGQGLGEGKEDGHDQGKAEGHGHALQQEAERRARVRLEQQEVEAFKQACQEELAQERQDGVRKVHEEHRYVTC